MDVTMDRKVLMDALKAAGKVVPGKASLPVLACVYLSADEDMAVMATNLDQSIRLNVPCEAVEASGDTVVAYREFLRVLSAQTQDRVRLRQEEDGLHIAADGSYRIATVSPEDFPSWRSADEGTECVLSTEILEAMRGNALFVSTDETRRALTGLYLALTDGRIEVVATNGHVLACSVFDGPEGAFEALIPVEVLKALPRVDEVHARFGESYACFSAEGIEVRTRLLEGPYVEYRQVIPESQPGSITVEAEALLQAVKQVDVATSSYLHRAVFDLKDPDALVVSGDDQSAGLFGSVRVDAKVSPPQTTREDWNEEKTGKVTVTEPLPEVWFSTVYLDRILRRLSGEVEMGLSGAFTAATVVQNGSTFLLMPMREN